MQTKRKAAVVIVAALVFTCILAVNYKREDTIDSGIITRPDYQSDTQNIKLDVYAQDLDKPVEVELEVTPRKYTQKEAVKAFEELTDMLPDIILGCNKSLDNVCYKLNLNDSVEGFDVQLQWFSSDYSLIDYDGSVYIQGLSKDEKRPVTLTVKMTSSDYEAESTMEIFVCNSGLSEEEKIKNAVTQSIINAEKSQVNNENIELPTDIDGKNITYSYKNTRTPPIVGVVFGMVAVAAVLLSGREQKMKAVAIRKRQLRYDYSELVSKLTLLVGAGMTIRGAWIRMTKDYLSGITSEGKEKKTAYDEMAVSAMQLDNGVPEAVVYENFARRCNTKEYLKLGMLLEQNIRKGSADLLGLLEQETYMAFEEHKEMARKKGEEAGTKLLIPMIIMLVIVMVIVMAPAMMSFGL